MHEIKVLLAKTPHLMRDLLNALIQRQEDMRIVGEVLEPIDILLMVGATKADAVIITLPDNDEEPGVISHLLAEYPHLLILAISATRNFAYVYRYLISKEKLSNVSNEEILNAIRKVEHDIPF